MKKNLKNKTAMPSVHVGSETWVIMQKVRRTEAAYEIPWLIARSNFMRWNTKWENKGSAHSLNHPLTHGTDPFLRRHQLCSYLRISQHFMELEGSLPYSQELSTGPYPELDWSNPYHLILSL
jgi:hypothetical protein